MDTDILHLRDGDLSIEVSRFGGSLVSATYRGIPFLKPTRTSGIASHRLGAEASFPLVPFGNRIEDNSFDFGGKRYQMAPNTADPFCLHGDGWLAEWDIQSRSNRAVELRYVHRQSPSGPYAYEVVQNARLDEGVLDLSLTVTNRCERPLPFGLGFHPFFPRTANTRLTAKAKRFWTERAGHLPDAPTAIPTGLDFAAGDRLPRHWINNAYDGWDGEAFIEWSELGLCLSLAAEGPFDCFMIYSPDADADFFCFEPMTHLPNGHNMIGGGGLVPLQRGQSLAGRMTLRPDLLRV